MSEKFRKLCTQNSEAGLEIASSCRNFNWTLTHMFKKFRKIPCENIFRKRKGCSNPTWKQIFKKSIKGNLRNTWNDLQSLFVYCTRDEFYYMNRTVVSPLILLRWRRHLVTGFGSNSDSTWRCCHWLLENRSQCYQSDNWWQSDWEHQ